jgi:anti-sigma factor RsiW
MLTCAEIVKLVNDYVDGRLDPETLARFEEHVSICPPCLAYLAQIRETRAQLARLADEELPEHVEEALLEAFRTWAATG